jgi:hypothetical protein
VALPQTSCLGRTPGVRRAGPVTLGLRLRKPYSGPGRLSEELKAAAAPVARLAYAGSVPSREDLPRFVAPMLVHAGPGIRSGDSPSASSAARPVVYSP